MNAALRERLATLEQRIGGGRNALVFSGASETAADLASRIGRWKAGEKVEGVSCDYSEGTGYGVVKFVSCNS